VEKIKFDDIEALQGKLSQDFGPFGDEVEVSQEMINQFADLTGDHQWIHIDVERCKKESPFGGPIAHGFLTLSLLPQLSARSAAAQDWIAVGHANVVNYGADKLRFLAPVPAGSRLHARSRLVKVDGTPKGTRMVTEVAIHVAGSDRPVLYQAPRG
jgi:acyl dehydratase